MLIDIVFVVFRSDLNAAVMTSGDWDLTLFTCTTSGQARVAVRFELIG